MIAKRGENMSVQVSTRIDSAVKQQFDKICDDIGVSPSGALSIFIKGVINHNGIPFSLIAPPETKPTLSRENVFGCMRGQFKMSDDFNDALEDFKEYME